MNPNSGGEQPGMANFEVPQVPELGAEQPKAPETAKTAAESSPSDKPGKQALPVLQQPEPPITPIQVTVDDTQTPQSTSTSSSSMPKETHIPEKEWVNRAKKIIAETHDDPHKQKHEISKVKAEYIKKRFNKTIPADDPVTK